jgi:hypothetical protein
MATRHDARILFDALALEGGLLPPDWLAKVAALEAPVQQPSDYDVPKGLELRDEITRFWRMAEALYADFTKQREHAKDGGERAADVFVASLLVQVFGFAGLAAGGPREVHGRGFRVSHEWSVGRVPVVVGAAGEGLDAASPRHGDGVRRRSAWGSLQEYLNANDASLWGIASNGLRLRIGRDNTSLTRPAWIEADLERIFEEDRFADFSVLWLVLHATRFAGEPAECPLERWRDAAREAGTRARDQLRDGVEAALLALGQGFLAEPSNASLRQTLSAGDLTPGEYFNELLRLVYRMIFLVTVEERGILHDDDVATDTRALYADGYAMRRLVDRSVRRSQRDRHHDKWAALRPVFAALGRAGGEPMLGLPELGGLFAAGQCPHLDTSDLGNRALLEAVFRLGWLRQASGLSRVNWKDMGPEELGSIYESLLELVPRISDDGRSFTFAVAGESAGNERKLTGSYYTPDSLVQQLLDTALEPVIAARLAADDDAERALLSITVIDPACGSGHFLLAAARRLASRLAAVRTGGTPGAAEYRHALRDVVTHCIHGVDRNPMALELARMSLWLETYTPDCALGFLDHHLVQGDALLGLLDLGAVKDGIPDDAFKALTDDDKAVTKTLAKLNRAGLKHLEKRRRGEELELGLRQAGLGDAFAQLDELDDDRLVTVEAKRQRYEALRARAADSAAALAADLFLGAFLMPKRLAPGEKALTESAASGRFPTTGTLLMALDGSLHPEHSVAAAARGACRDASVLHWPLAFPQVFAKGGFDVVLGNPPWGAALEERVKKVLRAKFAVSKDRMDTFASFLELSVRITRSRGYLGLVLPDILLLKSYPTARELVLDELRNLHLQSWGMAFRGVSMEVITLTGTRDPECTDMITAAALMGEVLLVREVPRSAYRKDKLLRFNLYYDPARQRLKERLDDGGNRFGTLFEIHEGVHSGNARSALFVDWKKNTQCEPLIKAGSEVLPMEVRWAGQYLDLTVEKGNGQYFNIGDPRFYTPESLLVRRTGDRVIAAVNVDAVWASNNLFVCTPLTDSIDPFWVAFVLNSPVITWYFRYTQPREGKAFSELKIVHLEDFPIPPRPRGWSVESAVIGRWDDVYAAFSLEDAEVRIVGSSTATVSEQD